MKSPIYQSLFARVFLTLWVTTALVVGGGIGITWLILTEQRADDPPTDARSVILEAAKALDADGRVGLTRWLGALQETHEGASVYVVDPDGEDLLHRPLPSLLAATLKHPDGGVGGEAVLPVIPAQPLVQLVAHDGSHYGIYVRRGRRPPPLNPMFRLLPLQDRYLVLSLALAVTVVTSWFLTRSVSRPLGALGRASRQLASGALGTRVATAVSRRPDELGVLAQDFDAMAGRLQSLVEGRARLLRDVSHELRSPLARMRVALGLARQSAADTPAALDRLDLEVERLDRLIGQVLSLARLDSQTPPVFTEPVDLRDVIEDVVRDADFEARGRQLRLDWVAPAQPHPVAGRAEWLASAVENVVRNALRYSPEGQAVDIALTAVDREWQITVADRGPGVPDGELERIFEPFYRVASARGRDSGGDGIGLAIVARAVRVHGGSVRASLRGGGGLVVEIRLPRFVA